MPYLPKRPGPYITTLLLIVLVVLAAWLYQALHSPELQRALEQQAKNRATVEG